MLEKSVWAAASLTLAAATACGGGDEPLIDCDPEIALCDVQKRSCQELLWEAAACQRRQRPGEFPPLRRITSKELRAELEQDDGPPREPDAWDITYGLLGLIEQDREPGAGAVDELVQGVLGFYDPETKEVTIISDVTGLTERQEVSVLTHEFIHVLQDRDVDLLRFDAPRSTDEAVANDALVEGEATLHSTVLLAIASDLPPANIDWTTTYTNMRNNVLDAIDRSPSPLFAAMLQFPYPVGGEPVTDAWLDAGQEQLNRLFGSDRVRSLADWQQGYPDAVDSPRPRLDCRSPDAPDDYVYWGRDQLGVAGVTALWSAHREEGALKGYEHARSLRGEFVAVYAKLDDDDTLLNSALVWQTRWKSDRQAERLATLLEDTPLFVRTAGKSAVIVASDDPALTRWANNQADDWLACGASSKALRKSLDGAEADSDAELSGPAWRNRRQFRATRQTMLSR